MKPTAVGDFLIILPTHNERAAITSSLQILYSHLTHSSLWKQLSYTVLVADNGSTDQTFELVTALADRHPNLLVTHTATPGRGHALKTSFRRFSARYYIYLDSDLPISLTDLDQMAATLQQPSVDAVVAYRRPSSRPLLRRLLTHGLRIFNRVFLGLRVHDAQAGFKGFSARAADLVASRCHDDHFYLDSEALFWIKQARLPIVELPVTWIDRRFNGRKSTVKIKHDIFVMGWQGLRLSLRHRPRFWKTLIALFIIIGSALVVFTNHDPDLGWHLRAGELILAQNAVPRHDPFLYTVPGHRWINHEWLVDVWLWLLYKNNLWIVAQTAFTFLYVVPFLVWLRRSRSPLSWLFIIASSATMTSMIGVRVQTIGLFLFWIILELLFGPRRLKTGWRAVTAGTFIMFIWANLHGSFPAGLFAIYLYFLALYFLARQRLPLLAAGVILPTLATLITPYGIDLYQEVWQLSTSRETHLYIQEWLPMLNHPHPLDLVILVLFALGLAVSLRRRPVESLIATAFFVSYLGTLRSGPLFVVAALFVVIYGLDYFEAALINVQQRNPFSRRQLGVLYACYLIIAIQIITSGTNSIRRLVAYNHANNQNYQSTVAALQKLRDCTTVSLFNSYSIGGTLIDAIPDQKLFVDGRSPVWRYPDKTSLMQNYIDIVKAESPAWDDAFSRFSINTALLEVDGHNRLITRLQQIGWQTYDRNDTFEILTKERHNNNCE